MICVSGLSLFPLPHSVFSRVLFWFRVLVFLRPVRRFVVRGVFPWLFGGMQLVRRGVLLFRVIVSLDGFLKEELV